MSKRVPFVGGNWKCLNAKTIFGEKGEGGLVYLTKLVKAWNSKDVGNHSQNVIGVPAIYIPLALQLFGKRFDVASENCYPVSGAFTGETSVDMLEDFGIKFSIVGHSERRQIFKEPENLLRDKTTACVKRGITVIGCIGETLEHREAGKTSEVVIGQTQSYIESMKGLDWDKFVLAYEPIWAIGTGKTASPEQAQEVHKLLRQHIEKEVGKEVAEKLRIIYGGSVKPANCNDLYAKEDIDGFLVGGASLLESFDVIINSTKSK